MVESSKQLSASSGATAAAGADAGTASENEAAEKTKNQFGTFGGVFTPSMLTIFGLIMFMRANQVVGTAGILPALFILTLSCSITFLTGLSIAGISSNTPIKCEHVGRFKGSRKIHSPGYATGCGGPGSWSMDSRCFSAVPWPPGRN